ncbi:hypothetical protein [Phenylobacterium sp.]|jgi:hypothetical protein|uniref:hypothetical protein n=1 Tax=Phenylobacterium sp. TaxID=1871053 RepID=UPI003783E7FF
MGDPYKLSVREQAAVARAPRRGSGKQWWNLPAKYEAAKRIKAGMRGFAGHNDAGDAMRHAELSRRLAAEIDPLTAYLAGVSHEIDNSVPVWAQRYAPPFLREHARENWHGQAPSEGLMDLRNNAEGRWAARDGRPVDARRLQASPGGQIPDEAPYQRRIPAK